MTPNQIVTLGWGSLLWDGGYEFDKWHEPWQFDGPRLKLEFSRISKFRQGALTLVIDKDYGVPTTVAHCVSRRSSVELAFEDLRKREGCARKDIGYFARDAAPVYRDKNSFDEIATWAITKRIDLVIWTDLKSNFAEKCGKEFSVGNALTYLNMLPAEPQAKANQYLKNAPEFVDTPLRRAWREQTAIDNSY